ncbi:hypothetical protein [Pseudooceanicola sp. MF1-13]|uniref:hypothetical protein n=1 Tax=Pseudooceanicola sp. MF1-13 TaxID=3379095 RepID=UPI003892C368
MQFDISHNGRTTLSVDRAGAESLGYPEEVIVEAERGVRKKSVKGECRRRIYAAASAETQMNMATAAAYASSKTASARSDEEKSVIAGVEASLAWVAEMRGNVATLVADFDLDISDDANWPVCPEAALAVVAMY